MKINNVVISNNFSNAKKIDILDSPQEETKQLNGISVSVEKNILQKIQKDETYKIEIGEDFFVYIKIVKATNYEHDDVEGSFYGYANLNDTTMPIIGDFDSMFEKINLYLI